jgi:hypothetical protein
MVRVGGADCCGMHALQIIAALQEQRNGAYASLQRQERFQTR